jgi:hypothetical protein
MLKKSNFGKVDKMSNCYNCIQNMEKDSDKEDFLANDFHTTITNTSPSLSESSKIKELKLKKRALTEAYINGKLDYQTYINETTKLDNEIKEMIENGI